MQLDDNKLFFHLFLTYQLRPMENEVESKLYQSMDDFFNCGTPQMHRNISAVQSEGLFSGEPGVTSIPFSISSAASVASCITSIFMVCRRKAGETNTAL